MGPAEDDFEDAKRLLAQSLRSSESRTTVVKYGADFENTAIAPALVEVGNGLPLAERTREWSRWTRIVKRKERFDVPQEAPDAISKMSSRDDNAPLRVALRATEKLHSTIKHPSTEHGLWLPKSAHWLPDKQVAQSAVIGRVIYPTNVVKHLKVAGQHKTNIRLSSAFWRTLACRREFLTSNHGLQPSFAPTEGSELSPKEFLLIKLSPKQETQHFAEAPAKEGESQPDPYKQLPDLEIRLDVDREQQTLTPKQIRLVFKTLESDLLLPHRQSDLRFVTQWYMNSSANLDPEILSFIKSSKLNVWGSDRLKTPSSLALHVPRCIGKDNREIDTGESQFKQQAAIEYAFAGLEHRTQLLYEREGFHFEYTVIEAGRIGGRREEFRVHAPSQFKKSKKHKGPVVALFDQARQWIASLDSSNKSPESLSLRAPKAKRLEVGLEPGRKRRVPTQRKVKIRWRAEGSGVKRKS